MTPALMDDPSDRRPVETVFTGKSPWKTCAQLLFLALLAGGVAVGFAASVDFRTRLRVEQTTAPWAAALAGGAATMLLVCAVWRWHTRIRWVGVSSAGLRWDAGRGVKFRRWDDFVRLERGTIEISIYGEELKAGKYTDVVFKHGRPLRVSTYTVNDYEDLIAFIQTTGRSSIRIVVPAGGSHSGAKAPTATHGPLQFDPDGVAWGGVHYRWEAIESYEVASGMLRIQPKTGPEFLRRLCDLGEWAPAVARLDANVGSRRVGRPAAVPYAVPTTAALPPTARPVEIPFAKVVGS